MQVLSGLRGTCNLTTFPTGPPPAPHPGPPPPTAKMVLESVQASLQSISSERFFVIRESVSRKRPAPLAAAAPVSPTYPANQEDAFQTAGRSDIAQSLTHQHQSAAHLVDHLLEAALDPEASRFFEVTYLA